MPATSTLRQVLIDMVERYSLGRVIPCSASSSTTFTLTTTGSPELRGPFTGAGIAVGSPVIVTVETSGTTVLGHRTYVSNWVSSTGVLTVSPAVGSDTDATEVIILKPELRDADRVIEAVNRALQNRIGRWQMFPLTYVPDGDLQGATVTDYWTAAANGTAAYVSAQVFPAGSAADAFGMTNINRVVQLTTSGGSSTLTGNGIRVTPTSQMRTWRFRTAIRLVSGSGTATFGWVDNTNAADISAQVMRGNDSQTMTTTTLGDFMVCEGTFQVPATCAEIAPRLSLSATGLVAQMTPIIAWPYNALSFPLPNRIESEEVIGNFFDTITGIGPGGLGDIWRCQFDSPLEHRIHDYGDHRTVTFNFRPQRPIMYEEYVSGAAVSAVTGTTDFPLDRVSKWAYAELMDQLYRDEQMARARADNGTPLPSIYRPLRNAAFKSAQNGAYEPALKHVVGRR